MGLGVTSPKSRSAQSVEPVTQALSRPWVSSRTPYRVSRNSWR